MEDTTPHVVIQRRWSPVLRPLSEYRLDCWSECAKTRRDCTHEYYYEHRLWKSGLITREENKRQTEAHKAAIKKSGRQPFQETLIAAEWPQSFSRFSNLPVELQHYIIQLAAKEAIADRYTKLVGYDEIIMRRSGDFDNEETELVVMKRHQLVRLLGCLLGMSVAVRCEVLRWLETRRVRGWEWEREVRSGTGQQKGKRTRDPLWWQTRRNRWEPSEREEVCQARRARWELRNREQDQRSGKRRDARRWGASVYQFRKTWHQETLRVEILD